MSHFDNLDFSSHLTGLIGPHLYNATAGSHLTLMADHNYLRRSSSGDRPNSEEKGAMTRHPGRQHTFRNGWFYWNHCSAASRRRVFILQRDEYVDGSCRKSPCSHSWNKIPICVSKANALLIMKEEVNFFRKAAFHVWPKIYW